MSNIQKLFSEKIEIFTVIEFNKVSILTGIIKISLKVRISNYQISFQISVHELKYFGIISDLVTECLLSCFFF